MKVGIFYEFTRNGRKETAEVATEASSVSDAEAERDQPADGAPWPWLRTSLNHCGDDPAVVINPAQARCLAEQLTAWADTTGDPVADQPRTDVRIVNTRTGQGVATGGNDPDVIGWSWPRAAPAGTDGRDQPTSDAATRLRLAHQARRAKEAQLDDVRRALCDVGAIEDGDPYGHADLADVIRQVWGGGASGICELPHATIAEEDECDWRSRAKLAPLIERTDELHRQTAGLVKRADELEQRTIGIEAENTRLRAELERVEAKFKNAYRGRFDRVLRIREIKLPPRV